MLNSTFLSYRIPPYLRVTPRPNFAIAVSSKKTRLTDLFDSEKNLTKNLAVMTQCRSITNRQTYR